MAPPTAHADARWAPPLPLLPLLLLLAVPAWAQAPIEIKFSLRNLSGGPVRVWWREPGGSLRRNLVPQSAVAIRNSSNIEINSFKGHEFVIRRSTVGPYQAEVHRPGEYSGKDEALLVVGDSNDIVIVDEDLKVQRRDAQWAVATRLLEPALDRCRYHASATDADLPQSCMEDEVTAGLWTMRQEWMDEEALRRRLTTRFQHLAAKTATVAQPTAPMAPVVGWPDSDNRTDRVAVQQALEACGGDAPGLPALPAPNATCAADNTCPNDLDQQQQTLLSQELDEASAAAALDSHTHCALWARLGECGKNPGYMRTTCRNACRREDAADQPFISIEELAPQMGKRHTFERCIGRQLQPLTQLFLSAVTAERNAKADMADLLRNMTCAVSPPTSPALATELWADDDGHEVTVDTLLNSSSASVRVLKHFVTADECTLLMDNARSRLHTATVAHEDNNQAVSPHRRAQAANVEADWSNPNDPITRISRRTYNITNAFTGLKLSHEAQEPFSVIQYDPPHKHGGQPQEYRPHCDGSCDGSPHLHGGRVATVLIYCQVPEHGGGTTFSKSDVFVQPYATDAVLFSYYDRNTGQMDHGQTEHSGCPVLAGTKWVITQWMRLGVGAENPWTLSDPTGARL